MSALTRLTDHTWLRLDDVDQVQLDTTAPRGVDVVLRTRHGQHTRIRIPGTEHPAEPATRLELVDAWLDTHLGDLLDTAPVGEHLDGPRDAPGRCGDPTCDEEHP